MQIKNEKFYLNIWDVMKNKDNVYVLVCHLFFTFFILCNGGGGISLAPPIQSEVILQKEINQKDRKRLSLEEDLKDFYRCEFSQGGVEENEVGLPIIKSLLECVEDDMKCHKYFFHKFDIFQESLSFYKFIHNHRGHSSFVHAAFFFLCEYL